MVEGENSELALNWASGATKGERLDFLRKFLDILPQDELEQVANMASKAKKRRVRVRASDDRNSKLKSSKLAESAPVSTTVSVPAVQHGKGWFRKYRPSEVVSIDVEKVEVKIPNRSTRKKFVMKAAKVSVVDKAENVVYQAVIWHKNGTYRSQKRINGIKQDTLERPHCKDPSIVTKELEDLFQNKLVIGVNLCADFESLGIPIGQFNENVFDLQWYWFRSKLNEHGVEVFEELSLRSLCKYYFKIDMQPDHLPHSDFVDAVWTMRLFFDVYVKIHPEPTQRSSKEPCNEIKHFKHLYPNKT